MKSNYFILIRSLVLHDHCLVLYIFCLAKLHCHFKKTRNLSLGHFGFTKTMIKDKLQSGMNLKNIRNTGKYDAVGYSHSLTLKRVGSRNP